MGLPEQREPVTPPAGKTVAARYRMPMTRLPYRRTGVGQSVGRSSRAPYHRNPLPMARSRSTAKSSAPRATPASSPESPPPGGGFTLAHVTHEAVEQLGGIGTVLEGLMCSPVYQRHVKRSILVGPTSAGITPDPEKRLGDHGEVLYSTVDQIDRAGLAGKFRPIEWAFNVAIVYGKRHYAPPGQGRTGEAEVLLIDVFKASPDRLNVFKFRLAETFGLQSHRYENIWDYEEYTRLAEPAFYALQALLAEADKPCVLFSHEFMGMPAALQAILDGGDDFRTIFHAHECSTARHLVENHPGHDTMFYNVLDAAREQGRYVEDLFGSLDGFSRHALISRSHLCDGVIAVGDRTRDELHFLNPQLAQATIDLVYNGLPAQPCTLEEKLAARAMLADYSEKLLGYRPDVLMSHVTRPVISKGLWRDVKVCHHLHDHLAARGQTGVLYILTSAGGVRRPHDVYAMEQNYGWPRGHREGFPDLVGPEVDLHRMIEPFNAAHPNLQIVLVNQFGWARDRIGKRLPEAMHIGDFRTATDAEFGMATYEPFGISPLEPLGAGAICVISNVCGCENFVQSVTNHQGSENVLTADYTRLNHAGTIEELKAIGQPQRDAIEDREAERVAAELARRLPQDDDARARLLEQGQALVAKMGWDQVIENGLVPLLERVCRTPGNGSS